MSPFAYTGKRCPKCNGRMRAADYRTHLTKSGKQVWFGTVLEDWCSRCARVKRKELSKALAAEDQKKGKRGS